ncbi:MAG TPA: hypothetical protein VHG30_15835 [Microvirga sp.]|nr:hypothetical protein [Microvirga sp.]
MIRATCHTADNALCLEFDATEWFRTADPASIRHVATRNWSSAWVADGLERRPGYESLHGLVDYARNRLREETLEDPLWTTFECTVDGPQAMAWLAENRPEVASSLVVQVPEGSGPTSRRPGE